MTEYKKTDVLLSVNNVGLKFGNKTILNDVNFQIRDIIRPGVIQGQVVSLVGRSGMGKTQLIRLMSGLYIHGATHTGEVLVNKEQTKVKAGDMGIVFQDYYMPEHLRIKNMLLLAAKKNPCLKSKSERIDLMNTYVNAFELTEHINKFPIQLSGGQKQRASICMQLLNGSNFLLMDEPFSGLDPLMIDKTNNLILGVSQSDELKTLIIVSHDLANCIAISDTVFILSNQGRESNTGASIVKEIDLIERDLAWHKDIKSTPLFIETINEVKSLL